MIRLKRLLLTIMTTAGMLTPAVVPAATFAVEPSIQDSLDAGSCLSTDGTGCPETDAETSVNNIIATVINIFSLVVGVVAVIMIIVGGLKYITSGGDSGNITGAKNTILYAVVGLVVVALAQVIVRFVLQRADPTAG